MKELLEEFNELLIDINAKADEIISEAKKLQKQIDELTYVNDYPEEESDREREILGI